jgi:hypothetical protein
VIAAAAVLSRGIGVTLAAAGLVALLGRRRFTAAACFAAAWLLVMTPWWVWQGRAAARNGAVQHGALEAPELEYGGWARPESAADTLRVVRQNAARLAFGIGYFELALPPEFTLGAIGRPGFDTALLHLACWGAVAAIAAGLAASLAGGWRALHLYGAAYFGMVLLWPFEPYRFLVPWTPFLLYFLAAGIEAAVRRVARGGGAAAAERVGSGAAVAACVLAALLFVQEDARILASTREDLYGRDIRFDLTELEAIERWIAGNTAPGDVIASPLPARLFLNTGRRGQFFWPDSSPQRIYYGPDREWWSFYFWSTPSETEAVYEEMRRSLEEVYRAAGIRYCVTRADPGPASTALARIISERGERFQPVFVSPRAGFRVYRLAL